MPLRDRSFLAGTAAWCLLPAVLITQGVATLPALTGTARAKDGLWLSPGNGRVGRSEFVVGWPLDSHEYASMTGGFEGFPNPGPVEGAAAVGATSCGRPVLIPMRPLWPGFVLNTLFYNAALVAGVLALSRLRAARRRARNRCSACGYSRSGLSDSPCPECGRPAGM
ncbi:MAG: hypothetical protein K2Q20_13685 [Phycisphaerales bacterium]|nr:hypothetical protein [Phycisphaerales bacterium]